MRVGYGAGRRGRRRRLDRRPRPRRSGDDEGASARERDAALRPQERFAALLGGRDAVLACEELVLRARLDLDAGPRPRGRAADPPRARGRGRRARRLPHPGHRRPPPRRARGAARAADPRRRRGAPARPVRGDRRHGRRRARARSRPPCAPAPPPPATESPLAVGAGVVVGRLARALGDLAVPAQDVADPLVVVGGEVEGVRVGLLDGDGAREGGAQGASRRR